MKLVNAFKTAADFPTVWEQTPDGFLRVKARTLKEGIMPYARHELVDIPSELDGVDPIMMLVPLDAMSSGETLRSLEGARVVAPEHEWVTPENAVISKGSSAGAARLEGPFHCVDLLITDPMAIEQIKARKLGEISGGYNAECQYGAGEWNGQQYHAKQVGICYNHIAILPPGQGRGGQEVRIMNAQIENLLTPELGDEIEVKMNDGSKDSGTVVKVHSNGYDVDFGGKKQFVQRQAITQIRNSNQGGDAMSVVKVKLHNTGKFINTDEEGAAAIADESTATEAGSGKKLEELLSEVEELNGQIAELTAQSEESKGELSVYKEKLDELLSDETLEAQAEGMITESADADEIIENACGDDEKKKEEIRNSLGRIGNSSIYKLRGTALQTAVLNAVGFKVENMSAGEVRGAFKTHVQFANSNKGGQTQNHKKVVAGATAFTNSNSGSLDKIKNSVNKMWGKK